MYRFEAWSDVARDDSLFAVHHTSHAGCSRRLARPWTVLVQIEFGFKLSVDPRTLGGMSHPSLSGLKHTHVTRACRFWTQKLG